jgi:hypothetical protein
MSIATIWALLAFPADPVPIDLADKKPACGAVLKSAEFSLRTLFSVRFSGAVDE